MKIIRRAMRAAHVLIVTLTVFAALGLLVCAVAFPFFFPYFIFGEDRGFYWFFATIATAALTFAGLIYVMVWTAASD